MIKTIEQARQWGVRHLTQRNIPSPLRECGLLLAHAVGCSYERIVAYRPSARLTVRAQWVFMWLVIRRGRGVPFAYLTNAKEFYGLLFYVNRSVLIPRPDSEALVTEAVKICTDSGGAPPLSVHDCGCGSGAIAIAIKHQIPHATVTASDKSWRAVRVARTNVARLLGKVAAPATPKPAANAAHTTPKPAANATAAVPAVSMAQHTPPLTVSRYSLLDGAPRLPHAIDIIIANLPYLTAQQMTEPSIACEPQLALAGGGTDGLNIIHALIAQLPRHQSAGGIVILEASLNQFAAIRQRLTRVGYHEPREVLDIAGIPRALRATKM